MENKLAAFESEINNMWINGMSSDIVKSLPFEDAFKDKRMLAIYLTQVYHYAVHTPRHQALVAVNPKNTNFRYMQYCFEHAYEETAHELMALKDIQSLGFKVTEQNMPGRLTSTDLMISFLYQESKTDFPIHHLGYGFWSENACPFIGDFMQQLMIAMNLNKDQMTFYNNHMTIDENHAKAVRKIINEVAVTEADWAGMRRVAKITFDLTLGIVKDTFEAYQLLVQRKSTQFSIFE